MTTNPTTPADEITAVILAGGKGQRMGGEDKGLVELHGRPLLDYIIAALRRQTGRIIVSANRNLNRYREYGYPVVSDVTGDFFGPLAGMAAGMQAAETPLIVALPCDSPFVPARLVSTLSRALAEEGAEVSVAHDGMRMQPVVALLRCALLPDLLSYLDEGGRKVDAWYARHRLALADFSASPDDFLNMNTPGDRLLIEKRLAADTHCS
jgi:molybdenum cofactor guanylyltransferase